MQVWILGIAGDERALGVYKSLAACDKAVYKWAKKNKVIMKKRVRCQSWLYEYEAADYYGGWQIFAERSKLGNEEAKKLTD